MIHSHDLAFDLARMLGPDPFLPAARFCSEWSVHQAAPSVLMPRPPEQPTPNRAGGMCVWLGVAEARAGARAQGLAWQHRGSWKGVGVLGTCSALQEGRYRTGLARRLERGELEAERSLGKPPYLFMREIRKKPI